MLKTSFYIVLALFFVFKAWNVLDFQYIPAHQGDEGARITFALENNSFSDMANFLTDKETWLNIHPPGDTFFRSLAHILAFNLGLPGVPFQQILSLLLGVTSVLLLFKIIERDSNPHAALLCAFLALTNLVLFDSLTRSIGENTALPIILLMLYLLFNDKRTKLQIITTSFLLLTLSLIRTEAFLFASIAIASYGLVSKKLKTTTFILAGGSIYMGIKYLGQYLQFWSGVNYEQAHEIWRHEKFDFFQMLTSDYFQTFIFSSSVLFLPLLLASLYFNRESLSKTKCSIALFAATLAALGILFYTKSKGITHVQPRNWTFPTLFLILGMGLLNRKKMVRSQYALFIVAILLSTPALYKRHKWYVSQTPIELKRFIKHLSQDSPFSKNARVVADHLQYKSWTIKSYLQSQNIEFCQYSCEAKSLEFLRYKKELPPLDIDHNSIFLAYYLQKKIPQYLMTLSTDYRKKKKKVIRDQSMLNGLCPDCQNNKVPELIDLKPEFRIEDQQYTIKTNKIFENKFGTIYELSYIHP